MTAGALLEAVADAMTRQVAENDHSVGIAKVAAWSVRIRSIAASLAEQPAKGEAVLVRPARVLGRNFMPGQPVEQVIGRAHYVYDLHHASEEQDTPQPSGPTDAVWTYRKYRKDGKTMRESIDAANVIAAQRHDDGALPELPEPFMELLVPAVREAWETQMSAYAREAIAAHGAGAAVEAVARTVITEATDGWLDCVELTEAGKRLPVGEYEFYAAPPQQRHDEGDSVWMFKDHDGRWCHFHSEKHRDNTIASGEWEVREFVPKNAAHGAGAAVEAVPHALDAALNGAVIDLEMLAQGRDTVTGEPMNQKQMMRLARRTHDYLSDAWEVAVSTPPQQRSEQVAGGGCVDHAMVERGLAAAIEASDARLPRYKVVKAILEAAFHSGKAQP